MWRLNFLKVTWCARHAPSRDPTMNAVNKSPSVIALMDFLRPSVHPQIARGRTIGFAAFRVSPPPLSHLLRLIRVIHPSLSIRSAETRNFQSIVSVRASPAESEASWSWLGTEAA